MEIQSSPFITRFWGSIGMNLVIKGQFNNEIKTVKINWEPKHDHVIYPNLPH